MRGNEEVVRLLMQLEQSHADDPCVRMRSENRRGRGDAHRSYGWQGDHRQSDTRQNASWFATRKPLQDVNKREEKRVVQQEAWRHHILLKCGKFPERVGTSTFSPPAHGTCTSRQAVTSDVRLVEPSFALTTNVPAG